MNRKYPFIDKVRELLPPDRKIEWLADEINKSVRWLYDVKIEKLEIAEIELISQILDFNFIDDYNRWRQEHNQDGLYIVHEPVGEYKKTEKKLTISFKISTTLSNAELNSSKMLNTIRMDCEKYGYDFELL